MTSLRWLAVASAMLMLLLAAAWQRGANPDPGPSRAAMPSPVETLSNSSRSVYELGEAILGAIEAGDLERLVAHGVTESEWAHLGWPRLPASRPGHNVPWDYAWRDLWQKSRNSARRTLAAYRGHHLRLLRVEFAAETTDYGTYQVYRDARCVVQNESDEIVALDLFGSVIEMDGRFKAFSFVVD